MPMTHHAACLLMAISLAGCLPAGVVPPVSKQALPATFPTQAAPSTPVGRLPWRRYFTDPNLQQLLDAAVRNNADLQMALQRIETHRASTKLANAALLPQVALNVGAGARKFGLYTMDGAGNAVTDILPGKTVPEHLPDFFVGLQSSWEIDAWGKLRDQRRAAAADYLASIEGSRFVIANLIADVASLYNELLAFDHELDIVAQTLTTQKKVLEVIKLQKEAGRANELAVQQFKAQQIVTEMLAKAIHQQRVRTENQINFLLGRFSQPIPRSKERFFQELPETIAAGIPSHLLANRPDVREAEYQIRASEFDLKAARAAFLPNFNIIAGLGFQAFNPEFLFVTPASLAYSTLGSVVAPIINRKALEAQFATAKANQLSAMYQYQKAVLNAYAEVATHLNSLEALAKIQALKKQQSELQERAVETAGELYLAARASYLEVLFTQQSALQAKLELVEVTKQRRLATIGIYKALGGGWT